MYTISGSANWANLADFIFSISRIEEPDRRYTRLDMLKCATRICAGREACCS